MFKFLLCFKILLVFITLNEGKFYKRGRLNDNSVNSEASSQKVWFPPPKNYEHNVKSEILNVTAEPEINVQDSNIEDDSSNYTGLWFPHPPNYHIEEEAEIVTTPEIEINVEHIRDKSQGSEWQRLWFPYPPNYGSKKIENQNPAKANDDNNEKRHECDNGKDNISVDFDPEDKRHSYNYICFDNRSKYEPNLNTSALEKEYVIPAAYEPPLKCLYEDIEYTDSIPSYGAFRPLPPKFGSYNYLPPQRWLHSLADGAIVMLYHPCAFAGQIEVLQNTLKGCLYRHIITPSQQLTPRRPLALLAWGKRLEMSVVDDGIVIKFIKENAKMGFRQKQQKLKMPTKLYDAGLLNEAHLVTDEQDVEICGYKEMR